VTARPVYWILKDREPVATSSVVRWGTFFEDIANRRVAETTVGTRLISTVFLGVDHGFGGERPVLFETMIFEAGGDGVVFDRCQTWDEAETMHAAAVAQAGGAS
jgi:hypothetical protein